MSYVRQVLLMYASWRYFPVLLGTYVLLGRACWWATKQRMTINFLLYKWRANEQGGGSAPTSLLNSWMIMIRSYSIIDHWTFSWRKKIHIQPDIFGGCSRQTYGTMAIAERCHLTGLSLGETSRLATKNESSWIDVLVLMIGPFFLFPKTWKLRWHFSVMNCRVVIIPPWKFKHGDPYNDVF